jgi:PAS domain S-box-containing protein
VAQRENFREPAMKEAEPGWTPQGLRVAVGIGVLYAALGVLWILASDTFVHSLSDDPVWLAAAQRYKGIFYVISTSLGLIFLVDAGYRRVFAARDRADAMELHARDLFVQHPKPMWVYERQTLRFLAVNEAATQYYGYSREAFLQMTLKDIRPPEDLHVLLAARRDAVPGHHDIGVMRHRKKSGELVFVHLTLHTVVFLGREAAMVMAIDVTADVLSRRALQRQQAQFRQLHQSLSDALWIASADGQSMIYVSPAIEQICGLPVAQMMDHPDRWLDIVHPDDLHIARASYATLQELAVAACEYRIVDTSGAIRWVSDSKRLIVDEEGLVTLMGGIVKDITEAKAYEVRRSESHLELEQLVAQRTCELVRANAELDAFARTIAHDLKSPLVSVVGFTQVLQKRHAAALGEDGSRLTARIEGAAKQMASLVNDLLSLSRVTTTVLTLVEVDLVPIAQDIMEELRRQEPGRTLRFDAPASLYVSADAGLMLPLLTNLLGNAWKFTGRREDAHVQLLADTQGPEVLVRIQDNGAGFDAGDGEKLFQPFHRFHTLSEFNGTGIGLTTCQRIVARHNQRIWVESTPGEGTSVFMTFAHLPENTSAS